MSQKHIHTKIKTTTNLVKSKALKIIYFENSVLGRTLWLLWLKYGTPSEKIEALTIIRQKNNKKHI